jgi:hypothetical protein
MSSKSLIKTDYFESEIISTKSKELSCRLIASLRPFLVSGLDVRSQPQYEMSSQVGSYLDQLQSLSPPDALQDMLICALSLKSYLSLCQKRFRLVFFFPGTPFNTETMKENNDTERAIRKNHRQQISPVVDTSANRRVKLCLFPALYECPLPGISSEHNVESWLFSYQTFTTEGDFESYKLVTKAVVVA